MFKVTVYKRIWSHGESTQLKRELVLPFAPFINLELKLEEWEGKLKEVYWNGREFECHVEAIFCNNGNIQKILHNLVKSGWMV